MRDARCCTGGVALLQGYTLAKKTPLQVAKTVEAGGDISHMVTGHIINVCVDPDSTTPGKIDLFEMWPGEVPDQAQNDFKWLMANYVPPDDLRHLFDRKEILIEYKKELVTYARDDILRYVGPNKYKGGMLWMPFKERKDMYKALYYDIKRRDA